MVGSSAGEQTDIRSWDVNSFSRGRINFRVLISQKSIRVPEPKPTSGVLKPLRPLEAEVDNLTSFSRGRSDRYQSS